LLGFGVGVWGFGVGGLGIGPNPQSPIPNPQSPIPNPQSPIIQFNNIYENTKKIVHLHQKIFKNK